MPQRLVKAFYKSKTILANAAMAGTGLAGTLADIGLNEQAGWALVGAGAINTALRLVTKQPVSLLGGGSDDGK